MKIIADFHIHSRYSRATSGEMNIPTIAQWAKYKGLQLIGTGDFTHPEWIEELKNKLIPTDPGTFVYNDIFFFLTAEVSNIYHRRGKTYKIHNLIFAPDFTTVEKISRYLGGYGKLSSDGRPILGLDSEDLVKIVLDISDKCLIIPAHAWTPHFSVFGSNSGFNTLEECFGTMTKYIPAIETGLSSDPAMNWRLSRLDQITLISNSDAHSPTKIGREANVFDLPDSKNLYETITAIIKRKDQKRFLYTIEFFPEEGKYHLDGHRLCKYCAYPKETNARKKICPVCGRAVTIGVLHRVEELADRPEGVTPGQSIPFKNIIPLEELIAEATTTGRGTQKVEKEYFRLTNRFGSEFQILLDTPLAELGTFAPERVLIAIEKMRKGEVEIHPGYDGEYGTITIDWKDTGPAIRGDNLQMELF